MTKTFTGPGGTYEVSSRKGVVRLTKLEGMASELLYTYPGTRLRRLAEMKANSLANGNS